MTDPPGHNAVPQMSPADTELDSRLIDVASMPEPSWEVERSWGLLGPLAEVRRRTGRGLRRFVRFRGDKIAYLRDLGVRIGRDASIINSVHDYGAEPWLVEIGHRVTITRGVIFLTHDGSSRVFRHLIPDGSKYGNRFAPIRILDNSFVGVNSILLPGVTVGPNSIVGAGSVVTKDVPAGMVAAGTPAETICSLEEYADRYRERMIPISSTDRESLRAELTQRFFGEIR